ncbi:MAG: VPLPA-CTERM sorting domain-containing protein [Pseudomonadota bacterium]
MATPAVSATTFFQGFETDTSGWFGGTSGGSSTDFGNIVRTDGTAQSITPFEGGFFGQFTQADSGPFTRFDGYRDTFPGTWSARSAIYLDTTWGLGQGFDYSVASNGSDGAHQRDFIFHVTKDTSTQQILVGGSNNTNFDPREDLETINHVAVTDSGWYIFEHVFRNDGGQLAVDLNLYTALGVLLFTETRSTALDTIPGEVGGNRYGWFTNIDIDGGISVDATQMSIVPLPAALPLMAAVMAVFGMIGWRRRIRVSSTGMV